MTLSRILLYVQFTQTEGSTISNCAFSCSVPIPFGHEGQTFDDRLSYSFFIFISLCEFLQFIINFIWRVATGKMTEVDDIREEEVLAKVEQKLKAEKAPREYTKNGYVMLNQLKTKLLKNNLSITDKYIVVADLKGVSFKNYFNYFSVTLIP